MALHKSVEVRGEGVAPRPWSEAVIDCGIRGYAEVGVTVCLECEEQGANEQALEESG